MIEVTYTIAENALIASGIYRLKLEGDTSAITTPGQFLDLRLPGFFLRRPISICDWDEKSVTLLYKVVGGGTDWLSRCTPGQALDALSGLGNGFDVASCGETTLLAGGGIGAAPLSGTSAAGIFPCAVSFRAASALFRARRLPPLSSIWSPFAAGWLYELYNHSWKITFCYAIRSSGHPASSGRSRWRWPAASGPAPAIPECTAPADTGCHGSLCGCRPSRKCSPPAPETCPFRSV